MTPTPSSKTIRALDRGLSVVELLSRNGQMSLADLRKASGLANPTLLRLLGTLQARGWVRRGIVEGQYELSHSLGKLLGEDAFAHPLAEAAAAILPELKERQSGSPSDVCAVRGPGRIEVVESTRLRGPMAPTRTALGLRLSMAQSAHGRVILAFSTPAQRAQHLAEMARSGGREETLWLESGRLEAEVARTRARGFGVREPGYWQAPFDFGPELGAIAVPVLSQSGVHGSLSLLWFAQDMTLNELLSVRSLEALQRACAKVGTALDKAGIKAPM